MSLFGKQTEGMVGMVLPTNIWNVQISRFFCFVQIYNDVQYFVVIL